MRDIHGIDEAVEVLRPHLQEIREFFDNENNNFKELLRTDHTRFGRVVKCHLITETYIERYLQKKLALSNLSDARLSYYQKVKLLPEHGSAPAIIKPSLLRLNRIRNRFAHSLDAEVLVDELSPLTDILEISGRNTENIDALDTIETFTILACTWLLVSPPHLEELFSRAFRNVSVQADYEDEWT